MVKALFEKYRIDFQMFEYDISDYVKYASESEGIMPDVIDVGDKESETVEEEEFYDGNTSETSYITQP